MYCYCLELDEDYSFRKLRALSTYITSTVISYYSIGLHVLLEDYFASSFR